MNSQEPGQHIIMTNFLINTKSIIFMEAVDSFKDLKEQGFPPSVRLHPLKGKRKGEWTVDINKVTGWRITFCFIKNEFAKVKIENYH